MNGNSFFTNHAEIISSLTENLYDAVVLYQTSLSEPLAVYANTPFYELTGFSEEDVIGKAPVFYLQKEHFSSVYADVIKSIEKGINLDKEMVCLTKKGSPFWAMLKSKKISTKSGDESYQLIVLRDLTRRKKIEHELEKALETAKASKEIKDRFLANMSHEMRTPINGIMGMAQLLESTELNEQQKEYLEELKISSENLLAIVNDILEFNFIVSGGLKLERREFNIRKQLEQLIKTKKDAADEKNVTLDLVVSEKVPELLVGDSVCFSQIMMNLVGNSIKFTNEGTVRIMVRPLEQLNGQIPIEIQVKDTGIGIPESLLESIFESFNQASKVTTYKFGGTGLGLSIVDQLVGRMDGTIAVESKEGEGTTFKVVIPFETTSETKKQKTPVPENENTGAESGQNEIPENTKILVVDDYLINRKIVKGMLEKMGITVDQAETGEEAIEMLQKENYAMVLMDVHMPGMGGLSATKKIRELEDEKKRTIPVIAITASVLQRDIEECKNAGMDDFIAKPFTRKELENTVISRLLADKEHTSVFDLIEEADEVSDVRIESLLEMTGGDKNMVKEMIELFIEQTPLMLNDLVATHSDGEFKAMSRIAHTLKPTFNYMDMDSAYILSNEIEELGKSDNPDEDLLKEKINELQTICERYLEKFRKAVKTLF